MPLSVTVEGLMLVMATCGTFAMGEDGTFVLVWSDEFDGPNGTAPDSSKWALDPGTGTRFWGSQHVHEMQYFTSDTNNAALDGQGHLVVTVKAISTPSKDSEVEQCDDGPCRYTSIRMKTSSQFEFTYGKVDFRIRMPKGGKGIWPAACMVGNDLGPTPWPECGEIDVVAMRGSQPNQVTSGLHGPGYSGEGAISNFIENSSPLSDDFHIFTVQWESQKITWFFDGRAYAIKTPYDLPLDAKWVFDDHPFFFLLVIAVGGPFDGNPDDFTPFPQTMKVDYVRVFQRN